MNPNTPEQIRAKCLELAIRSNQGCALKDSVTDVDVRNADAAKIVADAKIFYEFITTVI